MTTELWRCIIHGFFGVMTGCGVIFGIAVYLHAKEIIILWDSFTTFERDVIEGKYFGIKCVWILKSDYNYIWIIHVGGAYVPVEKKVWRFLFHDQIDNLLPITKSCICYPINNLFWSWLTGKLPWE